MKKMLALLLAAALLAGAVPAASASEETERVERVDIEEYTWEEALDAIAAQRWEGIRYTLKECKLKYWAPVTAVKYELTEEANQAGYLAYFVNSDESLTLMVTRSAAEVTMEDFQEELEEYGAKNMRVQNINGVDWLLYEDPLAVQKPKSSEDYAPRCLVASQPTEEGVVEFVFFVQSEEAAYTADVIMASIEPVTQPK